MPLRPDPRPTRPHHVPPHLRQPGIVGPPLAGLIVVALVLPSASGCVGMAAQLMYAFQGGNLIPASYDGLADQRVAVICRSDITAAGYSPECADLARKITIKLRSEVDGIDVVADETVSDWQLDEDVDIDPRRVGKAVGADRVIYVELRGFSTQGDATMYKGRADAELIVYDMSEGGKIVYQESLLDWQFPNNTGIHISETNPERFREMFIADLAVRISQNFYAYDVKENFGRDARVLHN